MAARVQHPAPHFKGTAVVDGGFEGNTIGVYAFAVTI